MARIVITRKSTLYKTMTKEEWANLLKVAVNNGWQVVSEGLKWPRQ